MTALGLLVEDQHARTSPASTPSPGDIIHTGAWPDEHEFTGKRVGVIGNGSTGTQVISAVAEEPEHLTVFHAHPAVQRAGR